ncbi:MAG: prolipoprotein diacylglyceryl transferase [Clostridia bacterium]|nr:prolipoprotein diacylglyceryl transferase [Clostridia bacterium]
MFISIPSTFSLFGLTIHIYGITSALAYLLGVIMTCVFAKKRGFKTDDIITLACYVIPLAIIGARVYYVLFRLDSYTSFVEVLKIWKGGLAFYGGMIGGALGVGLYCLIHKKNFLALIDIIAVSMILSQAIGRWGNFFNQEAYGTVVTDPKWQWFPFAVYIEDVSQWHLATFFYESMWDLATFAVLLTLLYKVKFKANGMVAAYYLVLYGTGRFFIEGLRTDSLYLGSMRVSQILSLVFVVLGLAYIIINAIVNRNKQPLTYSVPPTTKKEKKKKNQTSEENKTEQ